MEMLRIKRVPTVVSNFQTEEGEGGARRVGCGRNCLDKCCLEGTMILYCIEIVSVLCGESCL